VAAITGIGSAVFLLEPRLKRPLQLPPVPREPLRPVHRLVAREHIGSHEILWWLKKALVKRPLGKFEDLARARIAAHWITAGHGRRDGMFLLKGKPEFWRRAVDNDGVAAFPRTTHQGRYGLIYNESQWRGKPFRKAGGKLRPGLKWLSPLSSSFPAAPGSADLMRRAENFPRKAALDAKLAPKGE
jgi:hypothetical protein